MLYVYMFAGVLVGCLSNVVPRRWILLTSVSLITSGVIGSSLRWIDWRSEDLLKIGWRIGSQGVFWYLVPSLLFFIVPFVLGRYATRLVMVILQPSRE